MVLNKYPLTCFIIITFCSLFDTCLPTTMKLQNIIFLNAFAEAADILAETRHGTFHGVQLNDRVNAFLGIPYAQSPIGDLRFQPAQPPHVSASTEASHYNATAFGPACHQFMYRFVLGEVSKPSTPQSEDCLTLNVYAPTGASNSTGRKLPVYAWSYGGGFGEGAASVPLYDPTNFVAENEDIIVVTWK